MLFISLLILYLFFIIIFIVHVFILFIYCIISLVCGFFSKLFAIYVLNILEYMNRQQQPSGPSLSAHGKGTIFSRHGSKLVIKTESVHKYYLFTLLPWVFHVCDRTLCTVCFLHALHQQKYSIWMRKILDLYLRKLAGSLNYQLFY